MDMYRYKHGDRPLEGYTIERAAGRGGFGEVYYAISDSGRQVALKAIHSYEQIELRGISQCMNLKSPHLVTIFDVKHNDQGRPFVIMEYVSGPSLAELLKESSDGLGTQKAAFFLREIAKGLSFLHECGIVHRDLKPGNIFYENGYVKIGDYGLTKAITMSAQGSHTITVGTVQYMAPEIGTDRYDHRVDIYALGVVLYEMLTGRLPFGGSDPTEILMKHMALTIDVSEIEEPFAHVIKKALAKDPTNRYQKVQLMVEDIFGAEHVRNSVSQFSTEELSVVAERIAQKIQNNQTPISINQFGTDDHRSKKAPGVSSNTQGYRKTSRTSVPEWRDWVGEDGPYRLQYLFEGTVIFLTLVGFTIAWTLKLRLHPIIRDITTVISVAMELSCFVCFWYLWYVILRNRYRRFCAEQCLQEGDYVQGASFALAMGRLGVDQAAGGAIIMGLADAAIENEDSNLADILYKMGFKRWKSAHAERALRQMRKIETAI